jgi:imidazoleglycerol phosphate synthase glutamine amidotransferase subunit HisH
LGIAILDYGSGNLRSAQRAFEKTGVPVEITADFDTALNADGLVVPGVGAFSACMSGLSKIKGDEIVRMRRQLRVLLLESVLECKSSFQKESNTANIQGSGFGTLPSKN